MGRPYLVSRSSSLPGTDRRAGPRGGSLVLPPRPGWRDLAGRFLACPTPAASAPPTKSAPEPSTVANLIQNGPTSLAQSLAPGGLLACHGVHCPLGPRTGQTAGQTTER